MASICEECGWSSDMWAEYKQLKTELVAVKKRLEPVEFFETELLALEQAVPLDCRSEVNAIIDKVMAELDKYCWIHVDEKLPEETEEDLRPKYLIYNEDGIAVQEWRHYSFGWSFSDETGKPIYWMSVILPKGK